MKLTGHKTASVSRRHAIVSGADLGEAVQRLAAVHEESAEARRIVPRAGPRS